ncbi:MAG: hypothetical protein SynsKO_13700 [Synoicihabitans sp.]
MITWRQSWDILLAGGLIWFVGCANTDVPTISSGQAVVPDERQLLDQANAEEQRLLHSGFVVDLPETEAYLLDIAHRLAGDDVNLASSLRIRIMQDPTLNAFAMPNGALFIHTGLLARLNNEAQIATIIAHEMSHVDARHSLKSYRQTKTSLTWMNVLAVSGGNYGALLGGIGAIASVQGYSRDLEREADDLGFQRLRDAGYDLHATVQVFELLQAERERSERKEPFFFGSHPRIAERINSYGDLLIKHGIPEELGTLGESAYQSHLPAIIRADIDAGMRTGDFEGARQLLAKLDELDATSAETAFLHGEWHRKAPQEEPDYTTTISYYRNAIALDPNHAEAWRGLGLSLGTIGQHRDATSALQRYVTLAPLANDHAHMLHLISTWSPDS